MIFVSVAAIVASAYWTPSIHVILLTKTGLLISFMVAILGVVFRRGADQAGWLGYAVFGLMAAVAVGQYSANLGIDHAISLVMDAQHRQHLLIDAVDYKKALLLDIDKRRKGLARLEATVATKNARFIQAKRDLDQAQARLDELIAAESRASAIKATLIFVIAILGGWCGTYFQRTEQIKKETESEASPRA